MMRLNLNSKNKEKILEKDHRYLKRLLFRESLEKITHLTNPFSSLIANREEEFIYTSTQGLIFKNLDPLFQEIMIQEFYNSPEN